MDSNQRHLNRIPSRERDKLSYTCMGHRQLTSIHNSSIFQQNFYFKTVVQMNPDRRTGVNANM